MDYPTGIGQRILNLEKSPIIRDGHNPSFTLIDGDTQRISSVNELVQEFGEILFIWMQNVAVIHISTVEFHSSDDLNVVIERYGIKDSSDLGNLIANVHVFAHELFASEQ